MTKVYAVLGHILYENYRIIGIYATEVAARREADRIESLTPDDLEYYNFDAGVSVKEITVKPD